MNEMTVMRPFEYSRSWARVATVAALARSAEWQYCDFADCTFDENKPRHLCQLARAMAIDAGERGERWGC